MSLFSHFNSLKAEQLQPADSACSDPYGLASWSSHTDTTEHSVAIQIAAMLAGVAGPIVELDHGEVPRPMSPLVPTLVTKGGRRPRSLDALRTVPLAIDAQLKKRFSAFRPEELHFAVQSMRGARGSFLEETEKNRLAQLCAMLKDSEGMGAPDPYDSDLEPDVYDRRLRTVLRSGFVLDNTNIAKMPEQVASCHDSMALLPGFPLGQLLTGGANAFEEFFTLVAGRDLELPAAVSANSLTKSERGGICCILTATPTEIIEAMAAFPGFANRVILVDGSRPGSSGPPDEAMVAHFHHTYDRMVSFVADKRRRGHAIEFNPWTPEGRRARLNNQAAFLDACDNASVPCAGLEDLPSVLRWTFDLIQRRSGPSQVEVADVIHRLCLSLLADHVRILTASQQRAELIRLLDLAEKLVSRVMARQPVRRRDLIRTFNIQKVDRYRPVLDLLVEVEVLVEEPGHIFRIGPTPFETARSRWLSDPLFLS